MRTGTLAALFVLLSAVQTTARPQKSAAESFAAMTECGFPAGAEMLQGLEATVYAVHVRFNEVLARHDPKLVVPKVIEAMAWMIHKDAGSGLTFCEEYRKTRTRADAEYPGDDNFNRNARIQVFTKTLDRHISYGIYAVEDFVKKMEAQRGIAR